MGKPSLQPDTPHQPPAPGPALPTAGRQTNSGTARTLSPEILPPVSAHQWVGMSPRLSALALPTRGLMPVPGPPKPYSQGPRVLTFELVWKFGMEERDIFQCRYIYWYEFSLSRLCRLFFMIDFNKSKNLSQPILVYIHTHAQIDRCFKIMRKAWGHLTKTFGEKITNFLEHNS